MPMEPITPSGFADNATGVSTSRPLRSPSERRRWGAGCAIRCVAVVPTLVSVGVPLPSSPSPPRCTAPRRSVTSGISGMEPRPLVVRPESVPRLHASGTFTWKLTTVVAGIVRQRVSGAAAIKAVMQAAARLGIDLMRNRVMRIDHSAAWALVVARSSRQPPAVAQSSARSMRIGGQSTESRRRGAWPWAAHSSAWPMTPPPAMPIRGGLINLSLPKCRRGGTLLEVYELLLRRRPCPRSPSGDRCRSNRGHRRGTIGRSSRGRLVPFVRLSAPALGRSAVPP